MPIFHKQTKVGDRLTAELSGQRTEGSRTNAVASRFWDRRQRSQTMRLLSQWRTAFAPHFYELKNAISHYALVSSRVSNSDVPRLKLRTNSCHSRLRRNTAGKWHTTRQHEQKGRIQVDTLDLDWSAQGPNITRDAREKIAFFAFHAFVVEDSRFRQNRVRAKLYNCGACVCKSNVEIRIAGSFCRPQ